MDIGVGYGGYGDDVILGAFLHDIGHLVGLKDGKPSMVLDDVIYGTEDRETLGSNYLRKLGVPENVCYLVKNHVSGKRYLVYKVTHYQNTSLKI